MKTQKEAEDEFVATLTAADSSAVLTLCYTVYGSSKS